MILYLLVLLFLRYGECADPPDFKCSDDYCREGDTEGGCEAYDITKCANETLALLIPTPSPCSCCETCLLFQNVGDACIVGSIGQPIPSQMCGPGLICKNKKCVEMDPSANDPLKHDTAYTCDDKDICHCITVSGTQIYGTFPKNATNDIEQFCGCSALANKVQQMSMRALPFDDIYQPFARCLPDGRFDPLQCYEGFCSCIDSETGVYDDTIEPVNIYSLGPGNPICFNETSYKHTREYYRECQKYLLLLQIAKDFAEADGFSFLFPYKVECRPDGNFLVEPSEEVKKALIMLERMMNKNAYTGFI